MEITIVLLGGNPFTLRVNPEDTVGSLKKLIQAKLGSPPEDQKLVFVNGLTTHLDDDSKSISYYGLHSGCQVSLLITQPATMQVFLRNLQGQTSTYDIQPDETVMNFKKKVEHREGVPVNQQRLLFQSRELLNGKLSDYGVESGSLLITEPKTFQVFLRNEKGQMSTYDIKPEETVSDFKTKVQHREGVQVSQQRLLHQSREMTTGRLSDYNVKALSTIDLMFRLRGG